MDDNQAIFTFVFLVAMMISQGACENLLQIGLEDGSINTPKNAHASKFRQTAGEDDNLPIPISSVTSNLEQPRTNTEDIVSQRIRKSGEKVSNKRVKDSEIREKNQRNEELNNIEPKVFESLSSIAISPDNSTTTRSPRSDCKLMPFNKSMSAFRHNVYYYNLNFVYMKLVALGNFSIESEDGVIGGDTWVWTYYGKEGALEFLAWPFEFEIWSMGLLTPYLRGPVNITLYHVGGTCGKLVVGQEESEEIISNALVELPKTLMNISEELKEKYGPSFFCYKNRQFLNPHFFYILCKHIVCPLEAIKYECCRYVFDTSVLKREIKCDRRSVDYDSLWWVWPFVVAVVLFAFVPLVLMYCGKTISVGFQRRQRLIRVDLRNVAANDEPELRIIYLDDSFPVTLFSTIWDPIANICFSRCSNSTRTLRFFLPFLSLIFIALQILLDTYFLHGFVLESIKQGVPLGFRSMAAGYEASQENFMFYLGGPYVALAIYLSLTCMAVTMPSSLSDFLAGGLQSSNAGSDLKTALIFDLRKIERLGSIPVTRLRGFHKIYNTYLGQVYMLLNTRFWKEVCEIQSNRWSYFASSNAYYILFPFYILLCIGEIFLCVAINGFPLVSFVITISRAYSFSNIIGGRSKNMKIVRKILSAFLTIILGIAVLFFLYLFCTIFMDATLFVCRLFIFTYTGIVIYPKLSYGYLIFGFTVFYYLWDCIRDYSKFYWRVLKVTISACEHTQRNYECGVLVVVDNDRHIKGVKETIFEHVIEIHCPRRKQVFVSMLRLIIVLGIIGVSLSLLTKTDKFQELHVLMHVGTALFTCALPVILKSMCRGPEKSYKNKKFELDVRKTVAELEGYFLDDSDESDSDIE